MSVLKQIIQHWCKGLPVKAIARSMAVSRNTVKGYIRQIIQKKLSCNELLSMEDEALEALFIQQHASEEQFDVLQKQMPYFIKELQRTGVNRWVLWNEYKQRNPDGYRYSQFCYHLQQHRKGVQATLHLEQVPAEKLYIDFAGKKLHWVDRTTGEIHPAEILLPY